MSRTAICISSIGALVLATTLALAHAHVYQWIGKHGVVHYSDQWRQGAVRLRTGVTTMAHTAHHVTAHRGGRGTSAHRAANSTRLHEQAAHAVAASEARLRAKRCREAKAIYQRLLYARRLYTVGKHGHRHYMNSAEDNAARISARERVVQLCGSGTR